MFDADAVIVGAGAVGLACAARLARAGLSVLVIEQHAQFGVETSSRNSGVIHAGLYYPPGSLKARLCVAGRHLLYERCARTGVGFKKTGKLVVATTEEQLPTLEKIRQLGLENGAGELELLSAKQVTQLEPSVQALAALWSPETGIVDAHELMASYKAEAASFDTLFSFKTRVTALQQLANGWLVRAEAVTGEPHELSCRFLINSAGLHAERVAQLAGLDTHALGLSYHYCKGDYFALSPRWSGKITHLVYPVPVHAGLGVHLTLDLAGQVMAGPDTTYVSELAYEVDEGKAADFAEAVRRYLPGLGCEELSAGYAGIRPKLQGPGAPFRDFVVREESDNGAPGLINLVGIESPGLTASEALAERVLEFVR
ncbi:MAG: hypothetical protein RJA70_3108 [Pseudomonadota bacterium]|jgi:L-2-hydroxyglutarate oxidase LhgO